MAACLGGFEHPIMNGAGICKTVDQVKEFGRTCVAAVMVGSITVAARAGNPGRTYWGSPGYSLNSLGLPNPGLDYYVNTLPEMAAEVHRSQKTLIVSVAGFDSDEYVTLATEAARYGADLIELNLACPNVWAGGRQKQIACFDLKYAENVCHEVARSLRGLASSGGPKVQFGVKISPFSDPAALSRLGELLGKVAAEAPELEFVTAINTFPNTFSFDENGKPCIDIELGGLSGPAIKPIALAHVRQLRRTLPERVGLIGVGGVTVGRDVADFLAVGARCVQVTTAYCNDRGGPKVFAEILDQYLEGV